MKKRNLIENLFQSVSCKSSQRNLKEQFHKMRKKAQKANFCELSLLGEVELKFGQGAISQRSPS
jgi:hypothetical protein